MQAETYALLERLNDLDAATCSHGGFMSLYCPAGVLVSRVTAMLA